MTIETHFPLGQLPDFSSIPQINRIVLEAKGPDAIAFLQGLTTNTIELLQNPADNTLCIYTAFLTPQGRFMTDAFVFRHSEDSLWLDIAREQCDEFLKKLTMYKLRSKVELALLPDVTIYASKIAHANDHSVADPRHPSLGFRHYRVGISPDKNTDCNDYKQTLIRAFAPDTGVIPYQRGFIMEYGLNHLHAIDFTKGCYVGQELTARMHYRQLGKRELAYFVCDSNEPLIGMPIVCQGDEVGTVIDTANGTVLIHIQSSALAGHKRQSVSDGTDKVILTQPFICHSLRITELYARPQQ